MKIILMTLITIVCAAVIIWAFGKFDECRYNIKALKRLEKHPDKRLMSHGIAYKKPVKDKDGNIIEKGKLVETSKPILPFN